MNERAATHIERAENLERDARYHATAAFVADLFGDRDAQAMNEAKAAAAQAAAAAERELAAGLDPTADPFPDLDADEWREPCPSEIAALGPWGDPFAD